MFLPPLIFLHANKQRKYTNELQFWIICSKYNKSHPQIFHPVPSLYKQSNYVHTVHNYLIAHNKI